MILKKVVAWWLIEFGFLLDRLPGGQIGCSSGYCHWACLLDDRWQTNIYKPVSQDAAN